MSWAFRLGLLAAAGLGIWGLIPTAPAPSSRDPRLAGQPAWVVSVLGGPGLEPGRFQKPRSVAWDGKGTCYVVDLTDRVQAFDVATGRFLRLWRLPDIRQGRPERLVVAPDGNLLVTDTHYGRVLRYDPEGRLLGAFGSEGTGPGQMHYPTALRVLSDGRIAVSEYGGHDRIQFWDAAGACLGGFGSSGTAPGQFMRPQGLAQGPDGSLFVADAANQRIQAFTPEGRLLRVFGEAGQDPGRLSYPYDLDFDAAGRLVVLEYGSHRLSFWTPEGRWLGELGALGTRPGFLANPWGLCLLGDGTALITNSDNHRIERWRLPDRL